MTRYVVCMLALIAAGSLCSLSAIAVAADTAWSYTGANGPAKWGKLGKENATCGTGSLQSPIDIPDANVRKGDIPPLLFNYKPVPLRIVDTGTTIQVNYPPGSFVTISGKRYELVSIDFHKPSEEKVNGKGHDMSAHLLHKGDNGKLAIIAVPLDQGNENELVKALWKNLPVTKGKEVVVDGAEINAIGLLPKNKDYYQYEGSLSTPPCTENVTWIVLKSPTTLSGEQIARFGRVYSGNVRPVQARNDRDIVGSREAPAPPPPIAAWLDPSPAATRDWPDPARARALGRPAARAATSPRAAPRSARAASACPDRWRNAATSAH